MYYGGAAIDVAPAIIVMTQWYLAAGRAWPGLGGDQPSRAVMPRWRWVRSLRTNTGAWAHRCPARG
jgi:hypothetical protein